MVEEGGKEPGEEKEQELKPLNEKVYVHIYVVMYVYYVCRGCVKVFILCLFQVYVYTVYTYICIYKYICM